MFTAPADQTLAQVGDRPTPDSAVQHDDAQARRNERRRRCRDEGSVTAFVLVLTVALVLTAGLVFDGGRMVAGRVSAGDVAENAARAGAQEINSAGAGRRLNAPQALATARRVLAAQGVTGSVRIDGQRVVVTATVNVAPTLLRLVGVPTRSITVTRSSAPADH